MLVFIDTEFTNFEDMELISIGLIATDNSKMFYMENAEYDRHSCSLFVRDIVEPLLSKTPDIMRPKLKIEELLRDWFASIDDEVEIVIDYTGDWYLLTDLFGNKLPQNLNPQPVFIQKLVDFTPQASVEYERGLNNYFVMHPDQHQHNAICDAKANLYGFHQAMKLLY